MKNEKKATLKGEIKMRLSEPQKKLLRSTGVNDECVNIWKDKYLESCTPEYREQIKDRYADMVLIRGKGVRVGNKLEEFGLGQVLCIPPYDHSFFARFSTVNFNSIV